MVVLKTTGRQTSALEVVSEGALGYIKALRDGTLEFADFKMAAVMEGRGFHVTVGAFSSDIAGGGKTGVIDLDEPQFVVSIPKNISVMPIRIDTQVEGPAISDAEEVEILYAVDTTSAGVGMSGQFTVDTETIYNMNTLFARASACLVYSESTDSMTDPTLDIELARRVVEFDAASAVREVPMIIDLLYEPVVPPIINGPAMIVGFYGGDTAIIGGFSQIQWLEFPTTFFKM